MLCFDHVKYRSSALQPCRAYVSAGLLKLIVLFACLCWHTTVVAGNTPPQQSFAQITGRRPAVALAIDSVCDKIQRGDFLSAREIVRKSAACDSIGLRQLGTIIDEYMAIEDRREASKNDAYQEQIGELERLRQKGFPKDINDVSKVLAVASKALEYSNKAQEQALLKDFFVRQTVRQAERFSAECELKGRWLDAYKICYSKLEQIYKDDKTYSDYAEQLLAKADIAAFLQDKPGETCEERCAGIEKQMFIDAVNFLDSSYVNIVDYRGMAIKAINRCKLLAEVVRNSCLETKYRVPDAQYEVFSASLTAMSDEVKLSPIRTGKDKFVSVFERVLRLGESLLKGTELPPAILITQFAEGALSALDPHTVIYWPGQAKNFEKEVTNQFTGIGIRFSKKEEFTKVMSVLPDTPAYHSGFKTGDIIKAVDGVETAEMSANCVAESIAGPEGTKVTLTVRYGGENKDRDITLYRTRIIVPSICGWQRTERGSRRPLLTGGWRHIIDARNEIGYIRISYFNSGTAGDFEKTLSQLESHGLKGLILDLRSNPGGLLNSAIEIADRFIKEGLIARIQPRCGMPTYLSAHEGKTHPNYPMVVLIDRYTASSSEILAGVLQEPKHDRAIVVGERSYGKGSVQSIVDYLGNGAKLKYTAAHYYLPSGQRIKSRDTAINSGEENWGLKPNVNVKLRRDELRKMAAVQKANESMVRGGLNGPFKVQRFSRQETIEADAQLGIGLLVLKSKMIESGCSLALN